MTIVVDPDNLDRFQIAVDPDFQKLSIRGLGTERHAVDQTGDSDGTTTFSDAGANFTTDGVVAGDILTIISDPASDGPGIIGHFEVQSAGTTTLVADRAIPASTAGDLTYKINAAQTQGQAGPAVSDGVTKQAMYSFLKEEWRTLAAGLGNAKDLIAFTFPLISITREQFEIGGTQNGNWTYDEGFPLSVNTVSPGTTRQLIRTGGWQELDSAGNVLKDQPGIITLGALDADTVVYFQQHAVTADPLDFVLTGPVNQAINTFDEVTGPDGGTGFAITTSNTITRNDGGNWFTDGYRVGGQITIRAAEDVGNNGTFTVATVANGVDGALTVTGTPLTNNAADTLMIAAVNKRSFLGLFARKKARSYVQSALADIGLTTIETIVNRFPLSHTVDPAITLDDGQMAGDPANTVFTTSETHSSGTNGATVDNGDGTFDFTSATVSPAFNDGVLLAGDSLEITDVGSADIGFYEIAKIVDADTIQCYTEPTKAFTGGETVLDFTVRTRTRDSGLTNATLADVDGATGTLTSATATFNADNGLGDRLVVAGDIVLVTAGTAGVLGAYKVVSVDSATVLTLNTGDQIFAGETNQTYVILRAGMYLQRKSTTATKAGDTVAFNDVNPDTITRSVGSWVTDGFTAGMAITVSNADIAANNGTYIADTVTTLTLTLITEEGLTVDVSDANAIVTGENGFVRTLNAVDFPFNWRLFGNGGTLAQTFQFLQRQLRLGRAGVQDATIDFDIDESSEVFRGDVNDLLMSFASPTGTGLNIFIDDLASGDFNNATFNDITGDARNFAFIAGLTITLNDNITNDTPGGNGGTNKIVVFFADPDATPANGDEFDTNGAIIVQDSLAANMVFTDQAASPISTTFDYSNNAQGGRTPDTDAPVVIVCIGQNSAAYVQVVGTIQKVNNNTFALVAALERNYSNP